MAIICTMHCPCAECPHYHEFLMNLLDGTIGLDEEELRDLCWN